VKFIEKQGFVIFFFSWTPSRMRHFYPEERLMIWNLTAFTHLVTIFCIIWFCIGHIWFIQALTTIDPLHGDWCYRSIPTFHIILFVVQYIVCIRFVCSFIWNNPRILRYLRKNIHQRLNQFPNNDKHFDTEDVNQHNSTPTIY
jgi:hypothetical protein